MIFILKFGVIIYHIMIYKEYHPSLEFGHTKIQIFAFDYQRQPQQHTHRNPSKYIKIFH